jgi:hypothetical protein
MWPFKSKSVYEAPKYKNEHEIWDLAADDPSKAFVHILTQNASGGLRKHVALTLRLIQELEAIKVKPASGQTGHEKVMSMVRRDPTGEISLQRWGKDCVGYIGRDGVLYYAERKEVNLDEDGQ